MEFVTSLKMDKQLHAMKLFLAGEPTVMDADFSFQSFPHAVSISCLEGEIWILLFTNVAAQCGKRRSHDNIPGGGNIRRELMSFYYLLKLDVSFFERKKVVV